MDIRKDIATIGLWAYLIANNLLLLSIVQEGTNIGLGVRNMGHIATIGAGVFFPIWLALTIRELEKKVRNNE